MKDYEKLFKKAPRTAVFGTSYIGYIAASYDSLERALGKPHAGESGDRKTDCEWAFILPSDVVFTIYNYKDGPAYLGKGSIDDITEWSIGAISNTDLPEEIFAALMSLGLDAKSRRF